MKITAQEEYGLRCLLRLARAGVGEPLTIPEIAAAEKLSVPHVAKILAVLRQAGWIESVRGRTGGYHLTRSPSEIRLGAVMLALGEPLFEDPGYCERHAGPETAGPCVHRDSCTIKGLWETLDGWLRHILDQVTLDDLLRNEMPVLQRLRDQMPRAAAPLLTLAPAARQ